jgi:hypothetical protein
MRLSSDRHIGNYTGSIHLVFFGAPGHPLVQLFPCAQRCSRSDILSYLGIAIGLGLTLIHLVGIPVTNLSVNRVRSTGPALFVEGWTVQQLWLFWLAPIAGAAMGGSAIPRGPGRTGNGADAGRGAE